MQFVWSINQSISSNLNFDKLIFYILNKVFLLKILKSRTINKFISESLQIDVELLNI